MKKKMAVVLFPLLILLLSGCDIYHNCVKGTGPVTSRDFAIAGFSGVEVSSAMKVIVKKADRFQVTVRIRESLMSYVNVQKQGDVLQVGMKNGSYTNMDAEVHISMPELRSLELSGACEGLLEGDWQLQDVRFDLSGASQVKGNLVAEDAVIDLSGASQISLTGKARSLAVDGSGACSLNMESFAVDRLRIELSGASHATMNVVKTLDAEASGASTLIYSGSPTVERNDTSGASSIERK